jgi:hypothetical protein
MASAAVPIECSGFPIDDLVTIAPRLPGYFAFIYVVESIRELAQCRDLMCIVALE